VLELLKLLKGPDAMSRRSTSLTGDAQFTEPGVDSGRDPDPLNQSGSQRHRGAQWRQHYPAHIGHASGDRTLKTRSSRPHPSCSRGSIACRRLLLPQCRS